ncbi:MAG: hypothetical protein NVSMB54_01090 [Ktedonobacteraceae bacterium]
MERRDARPFQQDATIHEGWNIVELESHRQFRQAVNELIKNTTIVGITTNTLRQQLENCRASYGTRFITQLVRALNQENAQERQSVVSLLTLLNDPNTIPQLQYMAQSEHYPRSIRLSASLALAGMGATRETTDDFRRVRLYAIS